jgi:hypothetical protein
LRRKVGKNFILSKVEILSMVEILSKVVNFFNLTLKGAWYNYGFSAKQDIYKFAKRF